MLPVQCQWVTILLKDCPPRIQVDIAGKNILLIKVYGFGYRKFYPTVCHATCQVVKNEDMKSHL